MTTRQPGMDHPHYPWRPITQRPAFAWPNGAPLAVCVIVHLEHYEPANAVQHSDYSRREYGNRIGVFRMMAAMDAAGVKGTAAIDAEIAAGRPFLVDACRRRGWEFIGHGLVGNSLITSAMTEEQERDCITRSLDAVERHTGSRPVGWLGPEWGESARTPALLAELGLRYVCDWPNDEQPYAMTTPKGSLVSLPILYELDDMFAIAQRQLTTWRWAQSVAEAADGLAADGARTPRLLALSLHPWITGQPHRMQLFTGMLARLAAKGVWFATGREVVDAFEAATAR